MKPIQKRNKVSLAVVALLSMVLGAQVAVFATVDPGGLPPGYSYGYSVGWGLASQGYSAAYIGAAIAGACHNQYGSGTGNTAFSACNRGGVKGAQDEMSQ